MQPRTKSPSSSSLNPRFFLFLLQLAFGLCITTTATTQLTSSLLPSDAVSILSFKSKADLDNKLLYTLNERFDYCQWQGVKCAQGRVVRFVLQDFGLRGSFPPNTLSTLGQLRVLSLQNNSLSGPIPDLSPLLNLKSLFLSHNSFSAAFPPSILLLHRLTLLDLAHNNFTGPIPLGLSALDRLTSLKLQWNRFNGTIPPLNQSFLVTFDVSGNNLTGEIPVTPTLSRFDASSFSSNLDLCGQIINRACKARSPFFDSGNSSSSSSSSSTSPSTAPLGQSAQAQGGAVVLSPPSSSSPRKHNRSAVIIGFSIGVSVLIASILCAFFVFLKKHGQRKYPQGKQAAATDQSPAQMEDETMRRGGGNMKQGEGGAGVFHHQHQHQVAVKRAEKSGSLVFCGGGEGAGGDDEKQRQLFTLEQLMRASAELLGRGMVGTTYKAVLDNQLIVTVKRLDASKTAITSSDVFERHMDMVGGLRHPNLVPIMAYFQAKGERLVIYEYQPNGSLFNLVHGSRSTRAKPLHWTSCLKIAEDVAQGLAYIHQASKLVHGNLKSSNVLLGADFEACITDYCVATLADTSYIEDPDSVACKAPETRKLGRRATFKSDVYAFGVLLLELLTGKHPSQHPFLVPTDLLDWVRSVRSDDGGEDNQLGMLTEVASVCSLTSPEQRPAMWQVLKMIQEIKDSVLVEDHAALEYS